MKEEGREKKKLYKYDPIIRFTIITSKYILEKTFGELFITIEKFQGYRERLIKL